MGEERLHARFEEFNPPNSGRATYKYSSVFGTTVSDKGLRPPLSAVATKLSGTHPWPPQGGSRNRDVGGNFEVVRHEFECDLRGHYEFGSGEIRRGLPEHHYSGWLTPTTWTGSPWPSTPGLSASALEAKGTTAIARTTPTNPAADVATMIGELREGLPSLIGSSLYRSRFRDPRKVGDEYLNVEFGWKPLLSDIQKFGAAVRDSEKILSQYRRDSGKNVRRRYAFPPEIETTERLVLSPSAYPWPLANTGYQSFSNPDGIRLTITTRRSSRVWFSGCYTYYLDPGDTAAGKARRAAQEASRLLGLRLTPEVLWNLAPWSWAIDWVTNVGDIIHNVSAFAHDGLMLRWGYVMEESMHEVTHTTTGLHATYGYVPPSISTTFRTIRKQRRRATPWGFGFDLSGLTPRQWAIAGALGISRAPGARVL